MKRYFLEFAGIFSFLLLCYLLKPSLSSYLLTKELSSEQKVQEIVARKDQTFSESTEVIFNNEHFEYTPDLEMLSQITQLSQRANLNNENVLGTDDSHWIEVNLSQQRLYAWENGRQVYNYLVSTGKWGRTPTGDFRIWTKLASTTMKGGSKELGTYYYLPNVPCTMYFYKGYGLHGTYWHNNFGHPMSHGCVNMKTPEACTLFNWASVGTRVNVHY